jgi:hypothetical protein
MRKLLRRSKGEMKPWPPYGIPLGNMKVLRSVKVLRVLFVYLLLYFSNSVLILHDLFLLLLTSTPWR